MILINLLPHREAARKRRRETYQAAMLGSAMVGLLIAAAIYFWFQAMIENQQAKNAFLDSEIKVLENQIKELKAQEENLIQKLAAVKEAIIVKKNPASILLYIAKNIPSDLWLEEIKITDDRMSISGFAQSYASVGNFVNSLKSSVFIQSASIKETKQEGRTQSFAVEFVISRFDQ